jgi:hypothetical protein
MRCAICDIDSDTVTLTEDCAKCQEAIFECLMGYSSVDDNLENTLLESEFDNDG